MQNIFGSGSAWAQRQDVANSTPVPFAILQSVTLDFAASTKMLYGQYQFPVAIGRGTMKISGKAQFGRVHGRLVNDLFFGVATVAGKFYTANGESGTVTATAITVANSATFADDLGVYYSTTGLPLQRVASAPAVGQYTVAAGVYGFNATDNAQVMLLYYTYNPAGATLPQQKVTIPNPLLGVQPSFQVWVNTIFNGKQMTIKMLNCVSEKVSLATKLEDFTIPEFDFQCLADASNNLMTYSTDE